MSESGSPKRALIMAGGGLKVAFQAGVLQVWLEETLTKSGQQVDFQLADGASGGVFNLAMWCQGDSGTEIADKWRSVPPLKGLSVNATKWLPRFESLFTYDRFRKVVFEGVWKLRWDDIRSPVKGRQGATFNLFNATTQRQVVVPESEMDADALVSAVSLPFWFPPVRRPDGSYIDAVYATDANLEAAIEAGADELWIIWTVSQRGLWKSGPINQYFQVIEASANSRMRDVLQRIARNNDKDTAHPGRGEFGRRIEVRWLAAEVPLHYLFDFTRGGMQDAVNRGVAAARRWVTEQPGLKLGPPVPPPSPSGSSPADLSFSEYFEGTFAYGTSDPVVGAAAQGIPSQPIHIKLRATVDDLDDFVRAADHPANLCATVDIPSLGGIQREVPGEFQVFIDQGDFRVKQMTYVLRLEDADKHPVTLIARKYAPHQDPAVGDQSPAAAQSGLRVHPIDPWGRAMHPHAIWVDTTTLYTWLIPGHVTLEDPGEPYAAGIMHVTLFAFLRSLASTRTSRPIKGLSTYATFFARQLWQAYGGPAVAPTQPALPLWLVQPGAAP